MPHAPVPPSLGWIMGAAGNVSVTGLLPAVDRNRYQPPPNPRAIEGTDVRGRSSVQAFELGLGGGMSAGAEFDVTLPGNPLTVYTATLTARGVFPSDVTLTPVLGGTVYDGTNGDGSASKSTAATSDVFYGGDSVNCAAVISGPDGGPWSITLVFAAISLPGAN